MKELSIEEKAKANDGNYKAYTELISRLEDVKDAIKKQNYGIAIDVLCKPYPEFQIIASTELKESEDERTKKELVYFFKNILNHKGNEHSDGDCKRWIAWLEKQSEQGNNEDEAILHRFSFYSYKDEPNILYLAGLYVNDEYRNKGIGTKILKIADEVAVSMKCSSILLKTEIGSNAERLYKNNGYSVFRREENQVWLEKQGEQPRKVSIWKHWKDGIAGNGEGKLIYLVKAGNTYRLTSCLGFECDYIELSELDKLMHEKQGETFTKKDVDDAYLKGVCDTKKELEKQGKNNIGISEATKKKLEDSLNKALEKETPESFNEFLDEQGEQKQDVNIQINPSEYINDMGGNGCYLKNTAQKPIDKVIPKFKVGQTIKKEGFNLGFPIVKIEDGFYYNDMGDYFPFTDQDNWELVEQKPADKVEPKFNVGDWIINNDDGSINIDYSCCKITKVENGNYTIESIYGYKGYNTFETFDKDYHLWTIQDAKPGDVLVTGNKNIFIFKSISGYTIYDYCGLYFEKFSNSSGTVNGTAAKHLPTDYAPATKEQRDLLFKKMKEAGYEWDAEKKELKKISQRIVSAEAKEAVLNEKQEEQVSEEFINALGTMLNDGLPDRYLVSEERIKDSAELLFSIARKQLKNEMQEWSEEDEINLFECIKAIKGDYSTAYAQELSEWLKSLKPQNTWKPSDEQMDTLEYYMHTLICNEHKEVLFGLYADLKKLREE